MQLKTYRATDLPTALSLARREMGPNALVLATSEVRGRLGKGVEITVAADRALAAVSAAPAGVDAGSPCATAAASDQRLVYAASSDRLDSDEVNPAMLTAVDTLIRGGLSPDLAQRFARSASRGLREKADASRLAAATERGMQDLVSFSPAALRSRVLFVVGPPGAGKTATVAKVAARLRGNDRDVVFAQADGLRVGSQEQAETYARILGLRVAAVRKPADLARLADPAQGVSTVLVDTSGVGARDSERLHKLAALRSAVSDAEVAVLVPSGLHHEEARRVVDRFAGIRPTCVGFSKVDDAGRVGELVTAIAPTGLPLSFVTTGHRVPDLEEATPRHLAALLLRSGFDADSPQEAPR